MSGHPYRSPRSSALRKGLLFATLALLLMALVPTSSFAEDGTATWYGQPFHGRHMANGQVFDMNDPTTTASNLYPFGTWIKVTNPVNGHTVTVQVRDRGAFKHALDLSYAAFAALDNPAKMMIRVRYEVVPGPGAVAPAPSTVPSAPPPPTAAAPVAPAPPAKPTATQGPPPEEYIVTIGDSLFGIARRFGLDAAAVAQWNELDDPDHLLVGQRLSLRQPAAHTATPSSRGSEAPAIPNKVHIVTEGDTLWDIAAKYGTTPERLATLNDLADDTIVIGQRLRVADGASESVGTGSASGLSGQYVVQEGDTVFAIALKHGTTSAAIVRMNGLSDADLIQVGQVLAVP